MRWPAEWEPHEAVWIGFPGDPAEWPVGLAEAQREVAAFANAVADGGAGEQVFLVCRQNADASIAAKLAHASVEIIIESFGDIWLRDTAAIIIERHGKKVGLDFAFNGWGGKFEMPGDEDIGERLCERFDIPSDRLQWIVEGGAIDGDGGENIVTTRQCLLNPNRNPEQTSQTFENHFLELFGQKRLIWLEEGLAGDHTDGHVDNLARFVAPGVIAIPKADQRDDPNMKVFDAAADCAADQGLEVIRLPSVGRYEIDGEVAPASYMNFYIGNNVIVVPQFEASNDSKVLDAMRKLFPDRKVTGLPSTALLSGGGSFHCISQQIPEI